MLSHARSLGERGTSLLESLIALGLLGIIGVGFLTAVATGTLATGQIDERVTAQSLAQAQLEDIKSSPYLDSYPVTVTPPDGYEVSIAALPMDADNTIQKITVSVVREEKDLLVLEDLKVKW